MKIEKAASSTRNPGIDLLRGIAILLVMLVHIRIRVPVKDGLIDAVTPDWLLNALVHSGHEAVFIFFVISGFLITSHTLMRWGRLRSMDAAAFWRRRAARILPCLLLLVAVLSALHALGAQGYVIHRPGQSLSGAIVAALGFHVNWYEGQTGYLPAGWDILWSLAIEEVFYLGFPIVCLLIRNDWATLLLLIAFALSLPILQATVTGSEIWRQKAYLPGMAAIAMGAVTALVAARVDIRSRAALSVLCAVGAAGLIAVLCFSEKIHSYLGDGTMLLLTLSTACLLVGFHWRAKFGALKTLPGTAWLCSMGKLSYEIYLSHVFVVLLIARAFKASGMGVYWAFVWYIPAILGAWLLGWLIARYLSIPAADALLRRSAWSAGRMSVRFKQTDRAL